MTSSKNHLCSIQQSIYTLPPHHPAHEPHSGRGFLSDIQHLVDSSGHLISREMFQIHTIVNDNNL